VQQESGLVTVYRPAVPSVTGTLDANLSDHLDYKAGTEDAKLAASPLVESSTVTVTAQIRRTEIEQLSDLLITYLSANFPPILQPAIRSVLGTVFGWAKAKLDSITAVDGSAPVVISHHLPDPSTPTPAPSSSRTSPSSAPTAVVAKDPCVLVTAADASAAAGVAEPATTSQDTTVTTVCRYVPVGVDYSQIVIVQVVVPDVESDLASFHRLFSATDSAQPIDVGATEAFWDDGKGTLYLWQNGQKLDITVTNSWSGWTHAQSKAVAAQLAKVAITRM
jgi:hypothetical protein